MHSSYPNLMTGVRAAAGHVMVACALVALVLTPLAAAADVPSAVVISSFTAVYNGGNPVNVQWVTESEVDLALFIVYRGQSPLSPAQPGSQVYQTAPQGGGGVGGFTYNFSDTDNLVQGVSYYYMLKVLETTGSEQFFYANGGQPVLFGVTPTPTPTPTVVTDATATPTPTPTATTVPGATATPTPTATTVTAATATPTFTVPPTFTPTPFATFFVTNTPTPIPGIVTNTPPPGATITPFFTPTLAPFGTPTVPVGTPPPIASPDLTATAVVTVVNTPEVTTPPAIEATATVPGPPPSDTPTRLPPRTQAQATATPEASGATRTTAATGLLLCLGGGAIFGAGLLAVVGFVLWRRQPNTDDHTDDRR